MGIRKPVLSVQEARRLSSLRPVVAGSAPPPVVVELVEKAAEQETSFNTSLPQPTDNTRPNVDVIRNSDIVNEPKTELQPSKRARSVSKVSVYPSPRVLPPLTVAQSQSIARVQVFVSANVPVPGVSRSFDMLSCQYPPEKALQMILRRAMDDYEERLSDGSFEELPESYPSDSKIVVYTSRIMPKNLVELCRSHFDPLGFESTRAFGQKLANADLATFFAAERKRHNI